MTENYDTKKENLSEKKQENNNQELKSTIEHCLSKTGYKTEDDAMKQSYVIHIEEIYKNVAPESSDKTDEEIVDAILKFRGADNFYDNPYTLKKDVLEELNKPKQKL